ncbi:MAG: carboxylating nicotinate-nucleotide diphosphorylase [Chromatiaceae bacterium]|nr:MAG: carboxylating nicotinate-nucleotide diphosphorylase [Chromatiaceae bacterium]
MPSAELIATQVQAALAEDVGSGDLTAALLPAAQQAQAQVITRVAAVLCGTSWFDAVFQQLDPVVQIQWVVGDGEAVAPGQVLCTLSGNLRVLLTGERTALNYLQTLTGTATRARRYADAVAGLPVRLLDTRKTLPGLRRQQKYAVRCGGCCNHRMGLYDAILIKENHILAAGSVAAAVGAARALGQGVQITVEVESLAELEQALAAGAERILIDNFALEDMATAVAITGGRAELEASGGVTLGRLRAIAETGVDAISIGDLTKGVEPADLSMRLVSVPA